MEGAWRQAEFAQSHSSGGGSSHSDGGHDDGGHDEGGAKGKQRRGGDGAAGQRGSGGRGGNLRDVFRGMEEEAAADGINEHGAGGKGTPGGQSGAQKKGSGRPETAGSSESEEDSDRPDYAGPGGRDNKPGRPNTESGIKKGGIYGDMYIILRDENGVPTLDENGYVQVKYVDANGDLQCCIPRNDEGDLLATLPDGTAVVPLEVELGRVSVGRSPTQVLAAQYDEVLNTINSDDAVSVSLDASGRIVVTLTDGTEKTIDSPLENLALYYQLLTTGTISGIDDPTKLGDLAYLVDGTLTAQDLSVAASFFAAASDKTIAVTVDSIEYMNTILGIEGSLTDGYVDYSSFVYDRESVYGSMEVEVLVQQPDGSWASETVNVYDVILGGEATGELTNVTAFTTATDDARAIIDYLHEYGVPTTN
ncbi:hypothetical protein [Roseibium aggregatum]|uniref:Uncharacterized protein n=1 Tax=Roseibium aggregatum TaxID=187304 RepID=A0A926S4Z1_9HYPH|nr:hypothetical protein [Roseibium aggregatum]MBD1544897.1 hypothetical protein [Roseibium aggregatum]